jgi:hypothetical protein
VVLYVVWRRPVVYAGSLVNDLVCCGVNISSQFPLTANIRAMIVVFVDADLRVRYTVEVRLIPSRPKGCRISAVFSFFGGMQHHVTPTYLRNTAKSKYGTKTSSFSTLTLGDFSCRILAVFLEPEICSTL